MSQRHFGEKLNEVDGIVLDSAGGGSAAFSKYQFLSPISYTERTLPEKKSK